MIATVRHFLLPSAPGAFRLWLAMVVVLHHVTRIEVGKAPVLVFFALSGYWVHRVLATRYALTRRPWLTFIVSRWWRIAPVMLLSSVLALAAMAWLGDAGLRHVAAEPVRQGLSTVLAVGYAQLPVRPVGPAWSLDIEMQFYLVAPVLAVLVRRCSAIAGLAVGYGLYVIGLMLYPGVVLSSFIPFFMIGMVAAQHRWRISPRVAEASLAASIALACGILVSPWAAALLGEGGAHWPEVNLLLAALALPQALVSVCGGRHTARDAQRDAIWADQSYIVYMLHWPAIILYRGTAWSNPWEQAMGGMVLALIVAGLAFAVRRFCDRPLNQARSRWVARRRLAGASGACAPADAKDGDRQAVFA